MNMCPQSIFARQNKYQIRRVDTSASYSFFLMDSCEHVYLFCEGCLGFYSEIMLIHVVA